MGAKKILITGSKGVIGTWLANILRSKGHEVFCIDLQHDVGETGYEQKMSSSEFYYSRCDISDYRQIARIFEHKNFDFVYNCAAEFGRWNGEDFYEQVWKTNAIGLKNILRLQIIFKFKLIHFSSSEVYGDFEDVMSEDVMEKYEIKQLNDYALSKWVNEQQIRNHLAQYNLSAVVVRIFNTYGPGEFYHPYRSVNAKFCYNLLHSIPIDLYTGHKRTSTYLEDTVKTLSNIIDNFKSGETYNIGGAKLHTIEELVDKVVKYTNADPTLVKIHNYSEKMTTKQKIVDVSKSIKDLNHKNSIDLDEGIKKTVEWMKQYYNI